MKRLTYPLRAMLVAAVAVSATGCEDADNEQLQGNWYNTYKYFPGTPRGGAVCFQLPVDGEMRAFVGTGANTNKTEDMERYRDFYMASINHGDGLIKWTGRYAKTLNKNESETEGTIDGKNSEGLKVTDVVCSMPNTFTTDTTGTKVFDCPARNGGVAFALKTGDKWYGYVGLGYDGTNYLRDFWRFDPETNSWSKIANYPGDAVRYASCFVIDNVAYVGCGEDYDNNILGGFYKYDASTGEWSQVSGIGTPCAQAASFTCNGYGYVCGGTNGGALDVLQKYDATSNTWTLCRRLKDASRQSYDDQYVGLNTYGSTAFVLNDNSESCRAYLTTGGTSGLGSITWEYNPDYDYWVQKTNFEGAARKFAVSFVLNYDIDGKGAQDVAFVTTGSSTDMTVSGSGGTFYADCWLWQPQAPYETRD